MDEILRQLDLFYNSWRKIDLLYDQYARGLGMSSTSMNVLYYIYKGSAPCTQMILCDRTMLPKQTVHSAIQAFVRDGTILLTEHPDNKKSKYLVLSDQGRRFCEQIFEKLDRCEYEVMEGLSQSKRERLIALLAEYADAFESALNR